MISIEITHSPDPLQVGIHTFYKNNLSIGQTIGDILIEDHALISHHCTLSIQEDEKSTLRSYADEQDILLNGKVVKDPFFIKENDIIQIGKTNIKILKIIYTDKYEIKHSKNENENEKDLQLEKILNEIG